MRLQIGVVDFLNAYPLYFALENNSECTLTRDVPSALSQMLQQGACDAALISSAEFFRNQQDYYVAHGTGIAAQGRIESIRLFLSPDMSPNNVLSEPVTELYLDYASRSSVMLALFCMRQKFPQTWPVLKAAYPPYENILQNLSPGKALLLIGDPALHNRFRPSIDLGALYYELTGNPFIYAVWAVRRDRNIPPDFFTEALAQCRIEWEDMLVKACIRFGFDHEFTRHYLEDIIRHEISEEQHALMLQFYADCEKQGLTSYIKKNLLT